MENTFNSKLFLKSLVFVIPVIMGIFSMNTKKHHSMPNPFITEWDVNGSDTTTFFNTITIPLQSGTYNFDYTWTLISNPSIQISGTHTNSDGDFTTNFTTGEFYTLSIDGQFPHMRGYPKDKLLDVIQWGDIVWGSMEEMFRNWPGSGFSATDAPDLSLVTNMNRTFDSATNFNEDLNLWDVSNVQRMFRLFQSCSSFNGDVTNWNLSKAAIITNMFNGASSFNQDISGWVLPSSVNSLNGLFRGASSFNQDISDWDVSGITQMFDLFNNADSFNQDLSSWDVSNVVAFRDIFRNNDGFNQSIGNWKFKQGADFRDAFVGATAMDCQSWSSTILGWHFSNPTVMNININGGGSFEYDSIASIARDKLINEQGWSINGVSIGGDCGATFEFLCSDTLQIQNDTLFGNLTIPADLQVDLTNVVFIEPSDITIKAPIVNVDTLTEVKPNATFEIVNEAGCN